MIRQLLLAATTAALTLSAPANAADPIRIGVALSQTGNLADLYRAYRLDSDAIVEAAAELFLD